MLSNVVSKLLWPLWIWGMLTVDLILSHIKIFQIFNLNAMSSSSILFFMSLILNAFKVPVDARYVQSSVLFADTKLTVYAI